MWFASWLRKRQGSDSRARRRPRKSPGKRVAFRPLLEALEDRTVPSTLTVTSAADSGPGSLRAEIAAANPGDTIQFAASLAGQTITLTSGQLVINKNLNIEGLGENKLTVSGNNSSRVFDIEGSSTQVEIEDLTIANGLASGTTVSGPLGNATLGGGILNDQAHLSLSDVNVTNNQASGFIGGGGGVASIAGASLAVNESTFSDNRVAGTSVNSPGGAIFSDGSSSLTVHDSKFTGNQAIDGGAIADWGGSSATVADSKFAGNQARGNDGGPGQDATPSDNGGAIFASDQSVLGPSAGSTLTVEDSNFTGNQAHGGTGGAGGAGVAGGNGGEAQGGAVAVAGVATVADIHDCSFTNNQALGGNGGAGGASADGGNGGAGAGGALGLNDGTLNLSHSTFIGNQATGGTGGDGGTGGNGGAGGTGRGGGVFNGGPSPFGTPDLTLLGCLITLNEADGGAAGVGGSLGLGQGGGLYNLGMFSADAATIIARNHASTSNNDVFP